ncbi:SIRP1 [Symbiodinium sp. CCMP2456]|nr:SIRP1 [Symbiodinium sp. CCMP2456]
MQLCGSTMALTLRSSRWLCILCLRCAWAIDYVTYRWYGYHERFAMTSNWPESSVDVCQDFPAVCVNLYLNQCVKLPESMRVPWTRNITDRDAGRDIFYPARESKGGDYVLLTVQNMQFEPSAQGYLHIYSGCSENCQDCYAGTGQSLHPVRLPSQCGSTETQSVWGLLYNPGDGEYDTTFNCVDSLDNYWEQYGNNDLFATIMRVSIAGLIVLVVITLGSFIYLRVCKREIHPSYDMAYNSSSVRSTRGDGLVQAAITKEQVEAALPIVKLEEEQTCSVCLDTVGPEDDARRLQCQHAFHAECIMTWCCHRGQHVIECPMCRQRHQPTNEADRTPGPAPNVVGVSHEANDLEAAEV